MKYRMESTFIPDMGSISAISVLGKGLNTMTSAELRYKIEQSREEPFFFDRKTMQFFGDTMGNYGVRETVIDTYSEKAIPVYELYRRRPVKHGLKASAYFRKDTLARVFVECERSV